MSRREFKTLVARVMETLPKEFQPFLDNVVVEVMDEPDRELMLRAGLTDEEIDDGESLLGLFDPLELPSAWASDSIDTHDMMHRLWIFKRPHEEEFPDSQRLRTEVRKTVIHELAHHFGYTDRDLERFDDNPDPFRDEGDSGADDRPDHTQPSP
jgi:predicted Zn-dependent protease with MMP-like domain